jgi:Ca-activated chloride channel family protein
MVRILATAKDPSGALVTSLEKSDFAIRDNGVPQTISVFERQTDQPLSVAILIDNSGSTAKDLRYETDSVTRFVRALTREGNVQDAAALYSFNWEVVKQNAFTRNPSAIDHTLRNLRGEAGTSLYDAILLASRDIEDRSGRKVLIIVTDGGDTTSHTTFQRAVEAAEVADAVIYPVLVVPIVNQAGRNVGGENALTTLAQRTGGRVFLPSLGKDLDQAFDQIIRELRTQYLIAFYPKNVPASKDRFHTLDISVGNPELRISARNGYYGEVPPASSAATPRVDANAEGTTVRQPKPVPPARQVRQGSSQN